MTKYLERAEEDAKDSKIPFKHQGVFLTLHEEEPHPDVAEKYVTIRYADVCKILETLMAANQASMGPEVQQFLNHYLEVIGDATDMNDKQTEMANLARQLYRFHKKAIDFIMEHGVSTEFTFAVDAVFGEDLNHGEKVEVQGIKLVHNWSSHASLCFMPSAWVDALGGEDKKPWNGCETWWVGFPVICWFELKPKNDGIQGTLFLYAEVGCLTDYADRKHLIKCIQECGNGKLDKKIKFRADATKLGAKYSKFLNSNSTTIRDISDAEAIETGMRKLLKDFKPVFEAVEPALINFTEYMEDKNG